MLGTNDHVTVNANGTVGVISGSSVNNSTTAYIGSNSAVQVTNAASLLVGAGASLTGASGSYGVFADSTGLTLITGGVFTSQGNGAGLFAHGGKPVQITGGTFGGAQAVDAYGSGTAVITGGVFNSLLLAYFGGTITIAGGDFHAAALSVANYGNPHTTLNLFGSGFTYTTSGSSPIAIASGQIPGGSGVLTGTLAYETAPMSVAYSNDNAVMNINVGKAPPPPSTIDAAAAYGWGANVGWTNWRPSASNGASIGEYVCSGYVYSANVGWINLGSGFPVNNVQYGNASAADWGVNYSSTTAPGVGILRGYAYGANIGWIRFEGTGNPSVNLRNGQLYGYAYSANCGWINLGSMTGYAVKTDFIAPGLDTDGDGIADAWELIHFGNLTAANGITDADGDGLSDWQEYQDGTDPLDGRNGFLITDISSAGASGGNLLLNLTFTTTAARLYQIEASGTLTNPVWTDAGLGVFAPDSTATTTRQVSGASTRQFFRVRALRLGL